MLLTLGNFALEGASLQRPKPLLLLTYVALEGATSRRKLADLFYGDTKDPPDSLSSALKYLRQHRESLIDTQPKSVSTRVVCDAALLLDDLEVGEVDRAKARYYGPFLASYGLVLGEELEDWLYTWQDRIAVRLRNALLDVAEARADSRVGAKLAGEAWILTKDQGMDVASLNRVYRLQVSGASPLAYEIRKFAGEYGMPLTPLEDAKVKRKTAPTSLAPSRSGGPYRPAQVRDLVDRFEGLRSSTTGLVLCLWGDPGIGKSWILAQVKDLLSFPSYLVSATLPARLAPYHLPRAISLPQWTRTVLSRLAASGPVPPEDAADAIAAVLAANAPIVLQVEDLHEASSDRLGFWQLIAHSVVRSPGVALVATSRRPSSGVFTAEYVGAFTLEESARLLADEAESALPAETTAWIYAHAAGNPLFTLEFFRYLRRQGNLWHDDRVWIWRAPKVAHLPATIEALIFETIRAAHLSDAARSLVELKALLPAATSLEVLAGVAELSDPEALQAVQTLVAKGILRNHDFVHPLYQETQVRALTPTRQRQLANQIVSTLGESDPETAAAFAPAAALTDEAARDLLMRAAVRAATQRRTRRAGELLADAAEYVVDRGERITLWLQAAAHLKDEHPSRARDLIERVLAADPENSSAALLLVECLIFLGEGERAEATLHRTRLPEAAQQQAFELLVRLRTERHDYPGAVASWEAQPGRCPAARPVSKSRAAFSLAHLGRFTEADNLVRTTLAEDLTPDERADLLETRGIIAYYTGHMAAGLNYFDVSVALRRQAQDATASPHLMQVLRLRASTYWAFFRQADAIRDTQEAMQIASALGNGRAYAIAQVYLGIPLTELGEYERAEEALLESREVLRRADAREHLAACEAVLGGVYINWQQPGMISRALRHTQESLRISRETGAPVLISQSSFYASWAELLAGDAENAVNLADQGLTLALETGQRRFASLCYWMHGLAHEQAGQTVDAITDLEAAIVLAEKMRLEAHKLLFLIDRDRLRGDREAVKRHLIASRPFNFTGFRLPVRQQFLESLGLNNEKDAG